MHRVRQKSRPILRSVIGLAFVIFEAETLKNWTWTQIYPRVRKQTHLFCLNNSKEKYKQTCKLSSTCRARPAKFFQPLTDCLVKRKNDPCFRVFAKTEEDRYITEVRSVEPVLSSFLMTSLNFLDRLPFVDGDFLHQCDHLNFFRLEH